MYIYSNFTDCYIRIFYDCIKMCMHNCMVRLRMQKEGKKILKKPRKLQ